MRAQLLSEPFTNQEIILLKFSQSATRVSAFFIHPISWRPVYREINHNIPKQQVLNDTAPPAVCTTNGFLQKQHASWKTAHTTRGRADWRIPFCQNVQLGHHEAFVIPSWRWRTLFSAEGQVWSERPSKVTQFDLRRLFRAVSTQHKSANEIRKQLFRRIKERRIC